ncbi:MAG: radical SAM protein [Candidatus Omnitrophica bacterium]|nr:radical SAM protein [Candidatus Omnitrophota bacterium]
MNVICLFDPWKNKMCSCPQKYSLSAYTGCSHNCLYCYASSYIRNFFYPKAKKDFLIKLEKDIKKLPPSSYITMANSSDPYIRLEEKLKLTRQALKILLNFDCKINLVTKSALILRDIDIIQKFKKIVVSITITTLDEKLSKKLEPAASLPKDRLEVIKELSKYINVVCRLDPLIYPLNTNQIKEIISQVKECGAKQIITSTYKAKFDNLKRMCNAFSECKNLWHKLYLKEGQNFGTYFYLNKNLRKNLIEEVRLLALKNHLDFSSCREGFINLNTKNCDGSSFF